MKKNFKRLIISTLILIQLFPYTTTLAAVTATEAGNAIAQYAKNCYTKHGTEFSYYEPNEGEFHYRNDAYTNDKRYINPKDSTKKDKLVVDCVGWTNYCVHKATGLDCGASGSNNSAFVAGNSTENKTYFNYYRKDEISELMPGDLLGNNEPHIMVYVGDTDGDGEGEIVHCESPEGLTYEKLSSYSPGYTSVFRVNDNALKTINKESLNSSGEIMGSSSSSASSITGLGTTDKMADFYYNGIPDGKYSVTKGFWEILVDSLSQIFDYLIGILTMIIRMVFVGWTAIAEMAVTSAIKTITGEDNIAMTSVTNTNIDSGDNITIEKIVFNEVSVFDVNFFNFNDEYQKANNNNK